ncbi:mCG1029185, partial [Mus musculus]
LDQEITKRRTSGWVCEGVSKKNNSVGEELPFEDAVPFKGGSDMRRSEEKCCLPACPSPVSWTIWVTWGCYRMKRKHLLLTLVLRT